MRKDNSTLLEKVAIRREAMEGLADPILLETHGGWGDLWRRCYASVVQGVVFEKDAAKAAALAWQRPTWRVYQAECEKALALGVGLETQPDLVDIDPYGDAWPIISAVFQGLPEPARPLRIVVNDGNRKGVAIDASHPASMTDAVVHFGHELYDQYLDVCRWMMAQKANQAGWDLVRFGGYYCGYCQSMTHYLAELEPSS